VSEQEHWECMESSSSVKRHRRGAQNRVAFAW
jgi:hypothetical protein